MKKLLLMLAAIFLIGFGAQAKEFLSTATGVTNGYSWERFTEVTDQQICWPNWRITYPKKIDINTTTPDILFTLLKKGDNDEYSPVENFTSKKWDYRTPNETQVSFSADCGELAPGDYKITSTFTLTDGDGNNLEGTPFDLDWEFTIIEPKYYVDFTHWEEQIGTTLRIYYKFTETNGTKLPDNANYSGSFGIEPKTDGLNPSGDIVYSSKEGYVEYKNLKLGQEYTIWVNAPTITIVGEKALVKNPGNFKVTLEAANATITFEDNALTVPKEEIKKNSATLNYNFTVTGGDAEGMTYNIWVVNESGKTIASLNGLKTTEGSITVTGLQDYENNALIFNVQGMKDGKPTEVASQKFNINTIDAAPARSVTMTYRAEGTLSGANLFYTVEFEDFIGVSEEDLAKADFDLKVMNGEEVIAETKDHSTKKIKLPIEFDGESIEATLVATANVGGKDYEVTIVPSDKVTLTKSPFKVEITNADLSFEGSRDSGIITYSVDLTGTTDDINFIVVWAMLDNEEFLGSETIYKEDLKIEDGVLTGTLPVEGLKKGVDNTVIFNVQAFGPTGSQPSNTFSPKIVCKPAPAFEVRLGITKADFVQNDENPEGYIDYEVMVDEIYGKVKSFKVWAAWPDHEDADMMEITDFTLNNGKLTGKLPLSEIAINTEKTIWFKVQAFGEIPEEDYSNIPEKAVVFTPKMVMEFVTEPTFTAINSTEGYINYSVKFIEPVKKLSMLKIWVASPESEYGDMETYENVELPEDRTISGKYFLTDLAPGATTERVFKMQAFAAGGYETGILEKTVACTTTATGIDGIDADGNAEAVYYNLQGVRVANPEHGTYIMVKGGKATKVVL